MEHVRALLRARGIEVALDGSEDRALISRSTARDIRASSVLDRSWNDEDTNDLPVTPS